MVLRPRSALDRSPTTDESIDMIRPCKIGSNAPCNVRHRETANDDSRASDAWTLSLLLVLYTVYSRNIKQSFICCPDFSIRFSQ